MIQYYSAIKKESKDAIYSNTDATRDYHIKWSQSKRETNATWYHLYVELKYGTNEPIYKKENRLRNIANRLKVGKGEEAGGGMEWEVEFSKCKFYI